MKIKILSRISELPMTDEEELVYDIDENSGFIINLIEINFS